MRNTKLGTTQYKTGEAIFFFFPLFVVVAVVKLICVNSTAVSRWMLLIILAFLSKQQIYPVVASVRTTASTETVKYFLEHFLNFLIYSVISVGIGKS